MKKIFNLKSLVYKISVLMISTALLTSCSEKKAATDNTEYIISYYTNICNNGELYTDKLERLNFCDFETMKSVVLCPEPNCTHSSAETCSAFGMNNHPILYNGSLYFFESEFIHEDDTIKCHSRIYKADPDGTNRSVINEIDDLYIESFNRMQVYNDKAFFCAEKPEFNEYGATTGYNDICLYSYDISKNKLEKITELTSGYACGEWLYGIYNDRIYMVCSSSEEPIDYTDDSAIEALESHYMYYDVSQNTLGTSTLPVPLWVGDGYYIYIDGDSTVALDKNGKKIVIDNFNYTAVTFVNGILFSAWDGAAADLSSGKIYQLKERDFEAVAYVNGKYILKGNDEAGNVYKSVDYKDLIGDELA